MSCGFPAWVFLAFIIIFLLLKLSFKLLLCSFLYEFQFLWFFFFCYFFLHDKTKAIEPEKRELKDEDALPKLLVVGIALIGLGLLLANTALVAWFIIRKRIKGKKSLNVFYCFFPRLFIWINFYFIDGFLLLFYFYLHCYSIVRKNHSNPLAQYHFSLAMFNWNLKHKKILKFCFPTNLFFSLNFCINLN